MLTYSPGEWHAIVTPTSVALLAPEVPVAALLSVWESMSTGEGLAAVLGGLVGAFGASLGSFPSFVVVSRDTAVDEVRIVVRGPVHARAWTADEADVQVSGLGVTSWTERVIAVPSAIELGVVDDSVHSLPIRDGVVAARSLRWRFSGVAEAPAGPADALVQVVVPTELPPPPPASSNVIATPPPPPPPPSDREPEIAEPESEREPDLAEPEPESAVLASAETVVPDVAETRVEEDDFFDQTTGYDDLIFGETRMSTVEDAAVRVSTLDDVPTPPAPAPDQPRQAPTAPADAPSPPRVPKSGLISGIPLSHTITPAPSAPAPAFGDHDGETISAEQLAALQDQLAGAVAPSNALVPSATSRPAPTLVVSTGERYALDRSAVVGRRPRAVRATGSVPHLVAVASAGHDISRSHVELRVEGADVLAVDLQTTNGTRLLRLGAEPVRLHPGDSTLLVVGDRLDLGDGVVLSFEGL